MAVKWIEGAEGTGTGYLTGGYTASTSYFRSAPGATSMANPDGLTTPSLGLSATWVLGFGVYFPSTSNDDLLNVHMIRDAAVQCSVTVKSDGALVVQDSAGTDVLTGPTLTAGEWHWVEVKLNLAAAGTATAELRLNTEVVASDTALTLTASGTGADAIQIDGPAGTVYVDDFYADDGTTYHGDCVVAPLEVSANGATVDWAVYPVGDAWTRVSTSDSTWIESSTLAQVSLFETADIPSGGIASVVGVQVELRAFLDIVGERTVRTKFRASDGSLASGGDVVVDSLTPVGQRVVVQNDPNTGAAWALGDLNATQIGVELWA